MSRLSARSSGTAPLINKSRAPVAVAIRIERGSLISSALPIDHWRGFHEAPAHDRNQ